MSLGRGPLGVVPLGGDVAPPSGPVPDPPAYAFEIAVGPHVWTIEAGDPAEPTNDVLAGLKVAWSARQDDGWPTQHDPVQATFGLIADAASDLDDIDVGMPVYLLVEVDGVAVVEFGGTVRDVEARPHRLGMVYQVTALDYLVDLRQLTIHAAITDPFADYVDIYDILTDGVLPAGMPSLFNPPAVPYPEILGTMGSTWDVDGVAFDVLVAYFAQDITGGPTGYRNIIVPNLSGGLLDELHPYYAVRAVQEVGDTVTLDAGHLPTAAAGFRRLRVEPNRVEVFDGAGMVEVSERDHDGIATVTRRLTRSVNTPATQPAWITTNLEDLPNQWSTFWTLRAWETDPSLIEGWFVLPNAMRTLVHIDGLDPRHNPSGDVDYFGMLAGATLIFDAGGKFRVDFTLRRSVPAGTVFP